MPKKLSNKQRAFVEHYLTCWNASEAARRAGYSAKTAYSIGSENLRKPDIAAAIEAQAADLQATAREVLVRLTAHSRADIGDFLSPLGLIELDKVRGGKSHLIKKIKQRTTTIARKDGDDFETHEIELELYDAQAATVQLGKLLGLYVDKFKVETWQDEVVALLRDGKVKPDEVVAEFGKATAEDLFRQAGIAVSDGTG